MAHTMFLIESFCMLQLIFADNSQDINSVLNHVTSMERMLTNLQSQLTTTQTKLQQTESELAYLKSSQQSTESELESVKTELRSVRIKLDSSQLMTNQTQLQATKSELAYMKPSQHTTENVLESVRTELKTTQTNLQATELELVNLKSSHQSTEKELESVRSKLDSTEASVKSELIDRGRKFAFEVLLKNDKLFNSNDILTFDYVPLNIDSAYSPSSGIFVVPKNGTYFLWANVMLDGRGYFTVVLMKGNTILTRGYTGYDIFYGTATINHMVQLEKGDHVWIIVDRNARVRGDSYSSFGGILM